jgi:hypothetical protein
MDKGNKKAPYPEIDDLKALLRSIVDPTKTSEIDGLLGQARNLSQQFDKDDVEAAIDAAVGPKVWFAFPDRAVLDKIVSQPAADYLKSVLTTEKKRKK